MKLRILAAVLLLSGCGMIDHMTGEDTASEIRKTGQPATARILKIWDTGMTLNDNPIVGMRLMVQPAEGESFETDTKALVGRLDVPRVQPGAEVAVMFDPNDHTRVALNIY
jgi:hypothetical protein